MSSRHTLRAALLGQVLAFIIAVTAVSSTQLARQGVSAPTLQSSLVYLCLGLFYTAVHVRRTGLRWRCAWWAYALLAWLDVEANACLVLAYRFTSLTSVTLLDSFTIPCAVLLSTALLGAAYRRGHYAGAGIAVAGLLLLVVTDSSSTGSSGGSGESGGPRNPVLGDGLVLLGATMYALCNVLQEWLLGDVSVEELLGTLGLWGCLWSALQGLPLELHTLLDASWAAPVLLPFLGFAAAMFAFYSLVPFELKWGGAALLNISLLASDVWAALARYLWFGGFQGYSLPFFAASLVVVACGIALFTACGDVDTQLGAGSSGASPALPVVYQRVPGGAGPGTKLPQEALEELQRQGQQLREAPAVPLPNPFELPRGGGSGGRPGFMPLLAEEAWPSSDQGGSPAAVHAAPGAPAAVTGTPTSPVVELAGRQSFDAGSAR